MHCSSIVKKIILFYLRLSCFCLLSLISVSHLYLSIAVSPSLKLYQTATHSTANPAPQSTAKPKKPILLSYTSCVKKKPQKPKPTAWSHSRLSHNPCFSSIFTETKMVPNPTSLIRKSPLFYCFMGVFSQTHFVFHPNSHKLSSD